MDLPMRKNIRLKEYDYSQNGAYFITICIKDKHEILWEHPSVGAAFGRPIPPGNTLSEIGRRIDNEINKIETIYETVKIDKYIIMPNHIHMIILLYGATNRGGRPQAAPTISRIVNKFKGSITKQIGYTIWQKLFHDRIIRNEAEYLRIWQYIDENPIRWEKDEYYMR